MSFSVTSNPLTQVKNLNLINQANKSVSFGNQAVAALPNNSYPNPNQVGVLDPPIPSIYPEAAEHNGEIPVSATSLEETNQSQSKGLNLGSVLTLLGLTGTGIYLVRSGKGKKLIDNLKTNSRLITTVDELGDELHRLTKQFIDKKANNLNIRPVNILFPMERYVQKVKPGSNEIKFINLNLHENAFYINAAKELIADDAQKTIGSCLEISKRFFGNGELIPEIKISLNDALNPGERRKIMNKLSSYDIYDNIDLTKLDFIKEVGKIEFVAEPPDGIFDRLSKHLNPIKINIEGQTIIGYLDPVTSVINIIKSIF